MNVKVSDFDYSLPQELIAQQPCPDRDHSRLLVLAKDSGVTRHCHFYDLPTLLNGDELLVLNDTKVLPARLRAAKASGGRLEILLLRPLGPDSWSCLVKPAKRAPVGTELFFDGGLMGRVIDLGREGLRTISFSVQGRGFIELLGQVGEMPLPPYITEKPKDPQRYQTVYAAVPGAAAAPTAGLHFTPALFDALAERGVETVAITLHVGLGTFRPVVVENVEEHLMHEEYYEVSQTAAATINRARRQGRKIVAVGTTAVRVLETAGKTGAVAPGSGWTDIFIYPGYSFNQVDGLVTNFHLPRSTLLMLVSALAGRASILRAYKEAIALRYRFFSFGDAMLIL